ncbi:undecaprenyldiphospho-muramoylpentapeptide beta-N-acetylglucosaminyltransferase [Candidatus Liberibacter asiaticus]|uniref:UDP-N-acetylglucosamine--N-acetylmuramyl-(pentapeptide) pyrophosphoryl-undecaprenol N-acetylglucosamine transferase n=2 Tax=Liberibacter asiaticus TaxID=34021 RepID=C6XGR7_LIBAP|nr:undecaprenyldiphospho-muramoylpentapeptide beta-N-acetylglucosaminyltransferase [Candidatus Liberibacter asiaticus]ACT57570.1 N-acetylglucosaminyl transferase [Candidatus Liberibacter asiaticus str. psy62]AGH17333.1 N-acetylglucosaminyl transferase [Candidatus Liberibacter asiaticus str. gxpsy]ALK07617.1 undecaprenyldiphospho-muramoylpentapeptide beta-N-acetylglucosaminyltransferase [Candidatus Liberibacter asiaticus]ASK53108.1 undecaprenyldiphospho-muramoylpentapeptide beta-N- acetylglucosa
MSENNVILLVAGGTGGHVFPAVALSHELKNRGYAVYLITDRRARSFITDFPADSIYEIVSSQVRFSNPFVFWNSLVILWKAFIASLRLIKKLKPNVVVGFGGYHSISPLLAGMILRIPSMVHEQNVIMGKANRLLSWGVQIIARGLVSSQKKVLLRKIIVTGNPIRSSLIKMKDIPYQSSDLDQPFHLLVFGGSQGAKVFSDIVPKSIALIPEMQRKRLVIMQQVREDDKEKVQKQYDELGCKATLACFFKDIERYIVEANLLICRSGALTVSEIAVIGRPAILVPYPHSVDQDQLHNAYYLQEGGGAKVITENFLSPERLAEELCSAMKKPSCLVQMAKQVSMKGKPQAVLMLSDLVEKLAHVKVDLV